MHSFGHQLAGANTRPGQSSESPPPHYPVPLMPRCWLHAFQIDNALLGDFHRLDDLPLCLGAAVLLPYFRQVAWVDGQI